MMLAYIYDGSFEGLMTCIHEAYYRRENPQKIASASHQEDFFSQSVHIAADSHKSQKVCRAIQEKISINAFENIMYCFLSDFEDAGSTIYEYIKLGFKIGSQVDSFLSDSRVFDLHQMVRKVLGERHRMLGLLRFQLIHGGIYYASMSPDHNIVGLMAPHFAARMSDQNWVIHDTKRRLAALYNQQQWIVTPLSPIYDLPLDPSESKYQELWKEYFQHIAIQSRKNPRLQRQFMPARYWKHLTEKRL